MSKVETVQLWRLVKAQRAESAFDGEGAFRFGGRWNSRGHRAVYASATLSLALLEILVHLDSAAQVPDLVALSIRVPLADIKDFKPPTAQAKAMTCPWTLRQTREWGDNWLQKSSSPVLRMPSSIVPIESNLLINPEHPKFKKYTISASQPFPIDHRF
jgi:RES domain-containing protein